MTSAKLRSVYSGHLTIVGDYDGKVVTIEGPVHNIAIEHESDFETITSQWDLVPHKYLNGVSTTLTAKFDGGKYTYTVKEKPTETVQRTARALVKVATTKRLEQARNKVGAPEDAKFKTAPSGHTALPIWVTFTWEEEL